MNKKKILIIGNGCNNNYIKKILESNYDIIIRDKNDYSNLKGYEFDFVFIDEHFKIDEKLIKKENDKIKKNNIITGLKGYKSKKYKRYF